MRNTFKGSERNEDAELANPAPLVSIIMSLYNSEDTLKAAVASIIEQTYTNWELIICDDGSSDATLEVLKQSLQEVNPVKYKILKNDTNRKLAYSLNRCLEASSGDYIARMDGDDISEQNRLEIQVQFLIDHPEVDLVGSAVRRFNLNGTGEVVPPATIKPDKWTLGRGNRVPFAHPTILARRSMFDDVGNYTDTWYTVRAEDLDLWFKFFASGKVGYNLKEPLYRFREDEAAIRRRNAKSRFNVFVTRLKGNKMLGYPPQAYIFAFMDLAKIFIPYPVFDLHRKLSRKKNI